MKSAINMMADNFLTIDPLNFAGADVVIKYWNAVRNLINSLAVLILLVAGVAIMLQYEPTTFNLQSVLKRLIVAVVLINFSILVIQVAIDIANVVALGGYYMLNGIFENEAGIPNARASAGALAGMLITMLGAAAASGFTGKAFLVFLQSFNSARLIYTKLLFSGLFGHLSCIALNSSFLEGASSICKSSLG